MTTLAGAIFQCVLPALILSGTAGALDAGRLLSGEKKVIYHGWNTRDSAYVAKHWEEMEQMPFDGIAIGIALDRSRPTVGDGSTGNLLGWQVFGPTAFRREAFSGAIRDLQEPAWKRFTDNFLPVAIATRDQDSGLSWFDDARWLTIENNWRVLLTIARDGRCRGILLDPEHYDYECELFNYSHHRAQRANRPFASFAEKARDRGRQLGDAARELFPGITIGLQYGYTLAKRRDADGAVGEAGRYALLPSFLDGLLEASAPEARFVDLWEFGHGYLSSRQFTAARSVIENDGLAVTSNPAIYRSKVTPGMSLRIDFTTGKTRWQTGNPGRNYFTPEGFERAVRAARGASDRYVWIYSEDNPRFFPPENLPAGYLHAIGAARQPAAMSASMAMLWVGLGGAAALCAFVGGRVLRRRDFPVSGSGRILVVTGIFPPDRGGPASYVPKMARGLMELGHAVEVVCLSDRSAGDGAMHPFPVHRIRRGQFWPLRIAITVLTIWRAAWRHDVIYVNGLGSEAALAALLAGRPAVHKIVGDYAWERAVGRRRFSGTIDEYQTCGKSLILKVLDLVRTIPLKLARQIIVPSEYLARIVGGWQIPLSKVRVIHNAVTTPAATKPAIVLPPWSGKTLITVCRLVPWKGVAALIRILTGLQGTRLVIVGDGQLRAELVALAESVCVADRVIFLGDVPQSEVAGCLAQADAFVLNSTYEGLPHVVLEAMAAGIPVVATEAGGTGEVVRHEITGLLVPVGDEGALRSAVGRLWNEASLGRRLAAAAAARLKADFEFEVMVRETEAVLRGPLRLPTDPQPVAMEETP